MKLLLFPNPIGTVALLDASLCILHGNDVAVNPGHLSFSERDCYIGDSWVPLALVKPDLVTDGDFAATACRPLGGTRRLDEVGLVKPEFAATRILDDERSAIVLNDEQTALGVGQAVVDKSVAQLVIVDSDPVARLEWILSRGGDRERKRA